MFWGSAIAIREQTQGETSARSKRGLEFRVHIPWCRSYSSRNECTFIDLRPVVTWPPDCAGTRWITLARAICISMECLLQGGPGRSWSGIVGIHLQISKEERLTAWLVAATVWFNGHENRVDQLQFLRIVEFQDPPLFCNTIRVKHTEVQSLFSVRPVLPPSLKRAWVFQTGLPIKIIGIENQGLTFREKNPPIGFLGFSVFCNVTNLGNTEVPAPINSRISRS